MKDINEIVSAIVDGSLQESETIEMKRSLPPDLSKIAKSIVGIANSGDGYLVAGVVESHNHSVVAGIDNSRELQRVFTILVDEYTVGMKVIPIFYTVDFKQVAVVRIEKTEPIAYYRRRQSSPVRLTAYERIVQGGGDAYSYEQEIRIFAIPKDSAQRSLGNTSQSIDLAIDWSKVIRKVRIDKDCTDAELISVQQACFSVGINPVIEGYAFIGNIHKPANCVDKEIERFDIDAMLGNSRITIK